MQTRAVIGYWAIISTMTISFGGCLELSTSTSSDSSSSGSTSSGDVSSNSTSTSGSITSSGMTSSTSSSSAASSTASSASSSSSSASSSAGGMATGIVTKSDVGVTLLNNFTAVSCVKEMQLLPSDQTGEVLKCTHLTQAMGYFHRGLTADLQQGKNYTFTFFFKNDKFTAPFDQPYSKIGIAYEVDIAIDGSPLVTTEPYPNGWYRQRISFSPGSTPTFNLFFNQSISQSVGGSYWLYGFQVEEGFTPSEYIP